MKSLVFAAAAALSATLFTPAFAAPEAAGAQPTPAAPAAPGAKVAPTKDPQDPNQIICKSVEVTGSLFASKRTCRTRAAWEEMARAGREATESIQNSDSGTNIPH
jgi:hypothetical protein